jgi:hypothetical protein
MEEVLHQPPWSRVEGKSQVNLPQMPPLRGGSCMGVDQSNHPFAPRLPPGRPNNIQRVTVNEREQTGERQRERATERASFVRQSEQRDRTSRETERAEGQNEQRDRTSRETERAERQNEQRDRTSRETERALFIGTASPPWGRTCICPGRGSHGRLLLLYYSRA